MDMSSNGIIVDSTVMGRKVDLRKSSLPLASGDVLQAGVVRLQLIIPADDGMEELRERKWKAYREQYLASIPKNHGVPRMPPQPQTVMEEGRISLLDVIAEGATGKVRKAVDNQGNIYAVKVYRGVLSNRASQEIQTLAALSHVSSPLFPQS